MGCDSPAPPGTFTRCTPRIGEKRKTCPRSSCELPIAGGPRMEADLLVLRQHHYPVGLCRGEHAALGRVEAHPVVASGVLGLGADAEAEGGLPRLPAASTMVANVTGEPRRR